MPQPSRLELSQHVFTKEAKINRKKPVSAFRTLDCRLRSLLVHSGPRVETSCLWTAPPYLSLWPHEGRSSRAAKTMLINIVFILLV